jgi:membrane-bound lytic murein transglycosylase D
MPKPKAARAATALVLLCGTSIQLAMAQASDEAPADPEVVEIRSFIRQPSTWQAPSGETVPQAAAPWNVEATGGSNLVLDQIPFNAGPSGADGFKSLWERVRASYGLAEMPSPLVQEWENWYAARPDYVARMVARAERYLFFIVEEVQKRGMPSEIALLPMIESAYNPNAYSTAHASGIWQFIPSTGKNYGLKQNWWQDERRDVLAATRAALDYLEKLYDMFGSWELALASYNWGEGAVQRAVQRNEAKGLKTDYLSLEMPAETRNYVPKLIAVRNIIARPESFGLRLAEVSNRPYFTVVKTHRHIDVKVAAKLAEMPVEEFKALNPSHNRPVIRAESSQPILLPAEKAPVFQANLEAHDKPLTTWQSYTIGKEDRIERIAQRFGIALAQLKEVNSIPAKLRSLVGLTILVPSNTDHPGGDVAEAGFATPVIAPVAMTAAAAATAAKHVVRAGETLASIAERYRVSVAQLAARNGIRTGKILAGQSLQIAEAPAKPAASAEKNTRPVAAPAKAVPVKNQSATKAKSVRTTTGKGQGSGKSPASAKGAAPDKRAESEGQSRTQVAYQDR